METCSMQHMVDKLPNYTNFLEKGKFPVVVLEDILKINKNNEPKSSENKTKIGIKLNKENEKGNDFTKTNETPSTFKNLTSSKSKSSSVSGAEKRVAKKRKSWDPSVEYEIEKIVGYHRDKRERIWYLVKWKDWSSKHNTYEPIENMTNCNHLLMKYFEFKEPSINELKEMENQIENSLKNYEMYLKLRNQQYSKQLLNEFSEKCLNITKLFQVKELDKFESYIKQEYEYIVRCLIGMQYHLDRKMFERGQNYKICLELIDLRRKQIESLTAVENKINSLEKCYIKIENNVDLNHFPSDLEYVVNLKLDEGIEIPKDPLMGCECIRCDTNTKCCGKLANSVFAYKPSTGTLRTQGQTAIYECNWRCKCSSTCPNRVIQHGRKIKLCIFKTESSGWGVKTLEKICKGAFVCEYLGELIRDSKAVVRDLVYYKEQKSYLFDLDFNPDQKCNEYCIDATKYGNIGRFLNHSCDPNLAVYPVWVDCLDPNLPMLAFFARRNIKKYEELNFDYENLQESPYPVGCEEDSRRTPGLRMISRVKCQCKSSNCREWVFGSR